MGDPWYTKRVFFCSHCDFHEERTLTTFDIKDPCPKCDSTLNIKALPKLQLMRTSVQHAEYNVGLGTVTKNRRHREEIAKQRGLIEVGNESQETVYKETVVKRQKEKEKEWENL